VPPAVDRALRKRAKAAGKSINEIAVLALREALGMTRERRHRDLSDVTGSLSTADAKAIEDSVRDMDNADLRSQRKSRA